MELFNETKNRYFGVVQNIINRMNKEVFTEKDIKDILQQQSYNEPDFEFEASLLNKSRDGDSNLFLIKKEEGIYTPHINSTVSIRPSAVEKKWLKALTEEEILELFLKESTIEKLKKKLENIDNPINMDFIEYRNADKTAAKIEQEQKLYIECFKNAYRALKEHRFISYTYCGNNDRLYENLKGYPFRIEYSSKNNRFRLSIMPEDMSRPIKMNMDGLKVVEILEEANSQYRNAAMEKILKKKADNPIVLEIENKHNAIERCFSLFSYYDKEAYYDSEKDKHYMKLSYYEFDERELVKDILSLGSSALVISPENIRTEIINRVREALQNNY
ncbi:hypothetical protein bsdE14_32010 [Clostridium omnivorum]|uniref:WYL domain-containing protein n=2 Tax=Clostridium omnivorum TaxID=1604902 RepID=A0ABQ5N9K2_9CLOT|nr:hypothetical protein bsdE14_32010 [Clostridium sp. E14]